MKTLKEQNVELRKEIKKLRWDNLKMRLEIDILIDGTESKAAKILIRRYRQKRKEIEEREKAFQN